MMTPTILLILGLLYVTALFAIARYHEQHAPRSSPASRLTYALTLAVFCSSWTFYGAVGSMAAEPWSHTSIYLGPILLYVVFRPVVDRLVIIGHRQKVTSIADFLGARFGKRQLLGATVSVICLLTVMPYLALQLRALQQIWIVVNSADPSAAGGAADSITLLIALGLALFAILFGIRRLDGSERQQGLMRAMAIESVVKLGAFVFIALLALSYIFAETTPPIDFPVPALTVVDTDFLAQMLISALAVICLPRQFHVGVVELEHPDQTRTSKWFFPLYLFLFMILAVPISMAGATLFGSASVVTADTYVQVLPMMLDSELGVAAAFLGGISAATGMVLVAMVSVSIMVTNEVVTPLLCRIPIARTQVLLNLGSLLRRSRQITIVLIALGAWLVASGMSGLPELSRIGFLSFLGSVQLAPPLLLGLYWRRAHGSAMLLGMLVGTGIWLVFGIFPLSQVAENSLPIGSLVGLSLGANLTICVLASLLFKPTQADLRQAAAFLDDRDETQPLDFSISPIPVLQLVNLISPLLSDLAIQRFWRELEATYDQGLLPHDRAPRFVVAAAEAVLANAVGATSAGQIIKRLESERQLDSQALTDLLGSTQRGTTFNRESLEAAVENLSHGVSVVDSELRLVAWNSRYAAMFEYPPRFLFVGCPIERVYRFNAERGILASSDRSREEEIQRRLAFMREGSAHQVERIMPDGRVLDIRGKPLPGGGFVTTFVDITEYREITKELEEVKKELEQRVASGEETLSERNAMLRQEIRLRSEAEVQLREAFRSKAEFMSATSHDLLQPLNAAKLFVSTLRPNTEIGDDAASIDTWHQLELALNRTESMISELRDMARLDAGKQKVERCHMPVGPLLAALAAQYCPQAESKKLRFDVVASSAWIDCDPAILQRLLENLVANAVKYTTHGRVLVGVRLATHEVRIQVCDTGPGISEADQPVIFEEFGRLNRTRESHVDGLGLGLALVDRYARLLNTEIRLESEQGRGSIFSISLPRVAPAVSPQPIEEAHTEDAMDLAGSVLLLDNDRSLLEGLTGLLHKFGLTVHPVSNPKRLFDTLAAETTPDILIVDNHLDDGASGLETAIQARTLGFAMPIVVISADDSAELRDAVGEAGFRFMAKPIEPLRLRALVAALLDDEPGP